MVSEPLLRRGDPRVLLELAKKFPPDEEFARLLEEAETHSRKHFRSR